MFATVLREIFGVFFGVFFIDEFENGDSLEILVEDAPVELGSWGLLAWLATCEVLPVFGLRWLFQ